MTSEATPRALTADEKAAAEKLTREVESVCPMPMTSDDARLVNERMALRNDFLGRITSAAMDVGCDAAAAVIIEQAANVALDIYEYGQAKRAEAISHWKDMADWNGMERVRGYLSQIANKGAIRVVNGEYQVSDGMGGWSYDEKIQIHITGKPRMTGKPEFGQLKGAARAGKPIMPPEEFVIKALLTENGKTGFLMYKPNKVDGIYYDLPPVSEVWVVVEVDADKKPVWLKNDRFDGHIVQLEKTAPFFTIKKSSAAYWTHSRMDKPQDALCAPNGCLHFCVAKSILKCALVRIADESDATYTPREHKPKGAGKPDYKHGIDTGKVLYLVGKAENETDDGGIKRYYLVVSEASMLDDENIYLASFIGAENCGWNVGDYISTDMIKGIPDGALKILDWQKGKVYAEMLECPSSFRGSNDGAVIWYFVDALLRFDDSGFGRKCRAARAAG